MIDDQKLEALRADNERMRNWIDDLQSRMYINCVYCGHRYGPQENVPASMADVLKAHIAQCPRHPMSTLVKTLEAASHALRSYENGNSSPELAQDVATECDRVIGEARRA